MQLRLTRFYPLVLLFVIFIHVEALQGFSHVAAALTPNPMRISYHRVSPPWAHADKSSGILYHRAGSGSPEVDDLGQRDREDKWTQLRFDGKSNGAKSIFSSPIYSSNILAEKFAQEALGSKEMQDTIKNLASLKGGEKHSKQFLNEPSKVSHLPAISKSSEHNAPKISNGDNNRRKYREHNNRKHRKKHKNHGRKHHHKDRSKRNHSEKGSSKTTRRRKISRSVRRGRRSGFEGRCNSWEDSVTRRRKKSHDKRAKIVKNVAKKLADNNRESSNNTNGNLIGEEPPPSRNTSAHFLQDGLNNNRNSFYGNGIIAKLMQTTTRDPNKKQPGDQGVEYSEYYSDNENFLLPELMVRSKFVNAPAKDAQPGGIRSVREIVDDDFLRRYNYQDPLDDQMLEEDIDRPKRSGHRSVQVIEEPLNSMEYVDNSERPIQADGMGSSEGMLPQDLGGYGNYISGRHEGSKNARSLQQPNKSNVNPAITNVLDDVPSQLMQPQLARNGNSPYSSGTLPGRSTNPSSASAALTSSTASTRTVKTPENVVVNVPEDAKLLKTSSAASPLANSIGPSGLLSADSDGYSKVSPGKGMSYSMATIRPPVSAAVESSSRLRETRPDTDAQKAASFDHRNAIENVRSPDQIELLASREIVNQSTSTSSEKEKTNGTCPTTSTLKPGGLRPTNVTLMANETKAVASEILSEIIGELEELKFENPKDEQKEGLPCRLTGSWVTSRAGVRIDMKVTNHSVFVNLDYLAPPITTEGLLNVTWNVTGFAPFKRGGPFTLMATNNHTKTLAVFVGSCKVCQGIDTIEGSWTVSREPRDCRDFQMSTNIFNEIFRRTRLNSAIKDKQIKHESQGSSTLTTPFGNSSSSSEVTMGIVQEKPVNFGKAHNKTS